MIIVVNMNYCNVYKYFIYYKIKDYVHDEGRFFSIKSRILSLFKAPE